MDMKPSARLRHLNDSQLLEGIIYYSIKIAFSK